MVRLALSALSLLCWCRLAVAQDPALAAQVTPDIPSLMLAGDAQYLKGDYDAARQIFQQAWDLAQNAAPDDPARYSALKKLAAVRSAAGREQNRRVEMVVSGEPIGVGQGQLP